jgi:hypothetical protein
MARLHIFAPFNPELLGADCLFEEFDIYSHFKG